MRPIILKSFLVPVIVASLALIRASFAADSQTNALMMARVLAESKPSDWRPLDPENTLYLELASGRVVIELAPVTLGLSSPR